MLLLMATGCSNDENNNEPNGAKQTVQFSFTEEEFGADEPLSRASVSETKPQVVDLGDCEAEISVESEPAVKTRGPLTNANGHYTIRAYQGGTLKGEMKGTFSAGKFIPDPTSSQDINLTPGTYDFLAFGDGFTASGNELIGTQDKADKALIGTTTATITPTPHKQTVNFTMKHMCARLRTQFVCQKHIPNAITATLEETAANVIPTSMTYNILTKAKTYTNGTIAAINSNSPASAETKYTASNGGQTFAYTSTSDYHYFLPTTEGSKLKLTGISAGTVFWKPIPTFNVPSFSAMPQMQANKSYVVKIKLKPSFTYLMSDGTTGFFKETIAGGGTKTPIAVVVDKDNGMAIALKNTSYGGTYVTWSSYTNSIVNTHRPIGDDPFNNDITSGIDETWDASYSNSNVYGEKVKGKSTAFPAFYAAATYDPGETYTGSPALKWYLPSRGDFKWLFSGLGFGNSTEVVHINTAYGWYGGLANLAFTQVGGSVVSGGVWFWTSTEHVENQACGFYSFQTLGGCYLAFKYDTHPVRAFVKF